MTVEMLQRVYGHLHPGNHREVGEALTRAGRWREKVR